MTPTRVDKLFVMWIAAGLAAWAGALSILWGGVFGCSGASALVTLAALMLAVWVSAGMPGRVARAMQRAVGSTKLGGALTQPLMAVASVPVGKDAVRAMTRLLGASAALAVAGGLCSTAAVWIGSALAGALARGFLWGPVAWTALKLLVQFVGMLPLALGASVVFLVTALIRGGSGRDLYASVFREWLLGVAGGLAVLAGVWWLGANLLGAALVAGVALLAAAGGLFQRVRLNVRPRRRTPPIELAPQPGARTAIAAGFALVTLALLLQMRLLADVMGLSLAGRLGWAAASLAVLTGFLQKADRKSRPPGRAQSHGAVLGALGGLVLQSSLAARCLGGGAAAGVCAAAALAAQVPIAALAAVVISRHRRRFAANGGRARQYIASVAAGAAVAALAALAAGSLSIGALAALTLGIAGMAGAVVAGLGTTRRPGRQIRWAGLGALLICAVCAAPVVVVRTLGPMQVGTWLTAAIAPGASGGAPQVLGPLPAPRRWRSAAVAAAQAEMLADYPGRWWLVTASSADVPVPLPPGVRGRWAHPDPTALPAGAGDRGGDFLHELRAANASARRFEGILLAAMPADHPEAWCCYNLGVVRCGRSAVHEGGVVAIRTQVRAGGLGAALAVARTLAAAGETGWAVVALHEGQLDMLLAGSRPTGGARGGLRRPARREGAFVVPLSRLIPPGAGVRPIGLAGGGGSAVRRVDPQEFRRHLTRVQGEEGRSAAGG